MLVPTVESGGSLNLLNQLSFHALFTARVLGKLFAKGQTEKNFHILILLQPLNPAASYIRRHRMAVFK